jgi:hypothetical protein
VTNLADIDRFALVGESRVAADREGIGDARESVVKLSVTPSTK